MAPSLVEEAFEAVEAIDKSDDAETAAELGDLLMVIALIARIASEERRFDVGSVARAVSEKLVRRHPHVFGDVQVDSSARALANWEKIKAAERRSEQKDASALAGVPVALPALQRASRIAAKAISAGFRWEDARGALAKLREEVGELAAEIEGGAAARQEHVPQPARLEEELGDVLVSAAFLGHYLGLDPERAARGALRRFEERFRKMDAEVGERLRSAPLEELLAAWRAAKSG
jgi:MazG family protein